MTRVLVVDDEPQIRRALATNLRARDYEVDLAATGEEALRLAAERHPDVVILDIGLPGIDGIEVVRGLRGWSDGADHHAVGPRGRARQGRRPRRRRRRLRDQAVRHERAARPAAGRGAPRRAGRGDAGRRDRRLRHRPGRQAGDPRRRRGAPHPDRVGPGRAARAQPGQARHPAPAPPGGVGPRVRDRDQLPAGLHGRPAPQARAQPQPAPLLHHRAGHGLPLRDRLDRCSSTRGREPVPTGGWGRSAVRGGGSIRAGVRWMAASRDDDRHGDGRDRAAALASRAGWSPSRPRRSTGWAPTPADADGRRPDLRGEGPADRPPPDRPPGRCRRPRPVGGRRCPTRPGCWPTPSGPARSPCCSSGRRPCSDVVTGGRPTVGLRVPDHPVARALLRAFSALRADARPGSRRRRPTASAG